MSRPVARRRLDLALFALVFGLAGYFNNGWGWNQTARLDPVWAFVEPGPHRGTLRIDDFLTDPEAGLNTGDWAHNPEHDPHYYSNKAPGVTLLGIPAYAAIYAIERAAGVDPTDVSPALVNVWLLNLVVTVLPVALSALFFLRLATWLGCTLRTGVWLTALLYAGTLMLPFSTMVWAHTTAAAFAVMAVTCFFVGGRASWAASGALAGLAVLTDYGAVPVALALVGVPLLDRRFRDRLIPVLAGAAAPALVFALYHGLLFGSPFRLASSYSTPGMLREDDVLGMFGPLRVDALWGLTFSPVRGIFVFMPVLLAAAWGVRRMREHERSTFGALAVAVIVAALLLNLSYNTWQGGVSAGARYQIIALPFWVALLAFLPDTRRWRRAVAGLGAVSFVNSFVIAAVSPMAPDARGGSPLLFSWSKLLAVLRIDLGLDPTPPPGGPLSRGSLHVYPTLPLRDWPISITDPRMERFAVFNLGERVFGLDGIASLVPVLAAAALLLVLSLRLARQAAMGR